MTTRERYEGLDKEAIDALVSEAAEDGDAYRVVEILTLSGALGRIRSWVGRKWGRLADDQLDYAVAAGLNEVFRKIRRGEQVNRPTSYLIKVALRRARNLDTARSAELHHPADELERLAAEEGHFHAPPPDREEGPSVALRMMREAAATIGPDRPRQAVDVLLDAVEAGYELANQELAEALGISDAAARQARSRGLRLLRDRLEEGNLLPEGFELIDTKGDVL